MKRPYAPRIALLAAFWTIATPALAGPALNVLAAPNMRPVLPALAASYERNGAPKLSITYVAPAEIKSRIESGESADLVITLKAMADTLAKEGKLTDVITVASSPLVVAVPAGRTKPDISSPDAFKQTLLNANSIALSNNGPSGALVEQLFRSMGIEEQIKPKVKLVPPGGNALPAAIASGEVDLGIDQLIVLEHKPGIQVVGALPKEFGADIVMGAGIAKSSSNSVAAADFIRFLKSSKAVDAIKAHGMMAD